MQLATSLVKIYIKYHKSCNLYQVLQVTHFMLERNTSTIHCSFPIIYDYMHKNVRSITIKNYVLDLTTGPMNSWFPNIPEACIHKELIQKHIGYHYIQYIKETKCGAFSVWHQHAEGRGEGESSE